MKIEQNRWTKNKGWENGEPKLFPEAQLVIFFASRQIMENEEVTNTLKNYYPNAQIVGCSTSGEITGKEVTQNSLTVNALQFASSHVAVVSMTKKQLNDKNINDSEQLGIDIIQKLKHDKLKHVLVLSDGIKIDGTALVNGFKKQLPLSIGLTGGLAADGDKIIRTRVFHNVLLEEGSISVIGFYGNINISYSSRSGFKAYGPVRTATKSEGQVLYELDNKPALEIYKGFLGPYANELPFIGFVYPMNIWKKGVEDEKPVARTILNIDEKEQSILSAGGIPQGNSVQFMMTNVDMLVEGAIEAAKNTLLNVKEIRPQFCLLMTCTARKAVMKQRVEEEIEGVIEVMGDKTIYSGFYTYGEISPYDVNQECQLQNQSMAITVFWEN